MSQNLPQSDEIDIVLLEFSKNDMKEEMQGAEKKRSNGAMHEGWHAGYIPPYRAAYIRGGN